MEVLPYIPTEYQLFLIQPYVNMIMCAVKLAAQLSWTTLDGSLLFSVDLIKVVMYINGHEHSNEDTL